MPSVFLPDDVLAAALAALEAQGGSIGAPLAALRTHLAATAVHDASSSPSLTVPPSSTLPGPTGCSPPTTMSHARSPPTVALPANTLPADTFPSARHRCRTLTVRARARSVPLPDDYYLLEHCFRSLPHHPVDTAMGTALGSSAMSQPFAAPSDFDFDFSPVASPIRSSPTLQGSSPAKDAGKLSPLRLPTPFDFTLPPASSALFNPMSPLSPMSPMTPTFPPLQSSPSPPVLLGKRRAAELEEEEEEEGEEEEGEHSDRDGDYADAPPLKIRIRRVCRCTGTAGDDGNGGGGGGGGGGGPGPVHLWTKDCVRRGDRGRVGQDSDIGQMPCHVDGCEHQQCQEEARGGSNGDEENNSQEGSRKRPKKAPAAKKGQVGWCVDEEGGPILTKAGGKLLGQLLGVFGRHHRQALEAVLRGPSGAAESSIGRATDTAALVKRLVKQSEDLRIAELERMVTLVQLALNVDSEQRDAKLKCLRNVSLASLAKTHGQAQRTFAEWVEHGHRLLLLCAAGSMYLLPVIAALELRTTITRQCTARDLISVASALRSVKHGQWLPMVRRMMVPLHYMRGCAGWIQSFTLHYTLPCKQGADAETKVLHLYDMKELDGIYDDVQTNYVRLPERSAEWEVTTLPLWKPLEDPERLKLPTPRTIKTPLDLSSAKNRKCPVTRKNRDRFTDTQRVHAGNAHVATSVDDLESHLKTNHAGGQNTPGVYVEAGGSTLNGHALFIRDVHDELVTLSFSIPEEYKQNLANALDHIHAALPGEFKDEDSRRNAFKYLSIHYSWYARFAEKGHTAPTDVHPDKLRKDHGGRVNIEGRTPHQSKEILENPGEYALLAEAFTDLFEFLRVALKEFLPEDTMELSMYAEELPLHASSPCYPFGGFVINLSSCTWSHRDKKDKRLCLIVPLGKFRGGQLCLVEAGLSFNLQMGDVLVFPSCNLTHFNCHFQGLRATLVLHSDREGDRWVEDANGWAAHVIRHGRPRK